MVIKTPKSDRAANYHRNPDFEFGIVFPQFPRGIVETLAVSA